MLEGWTRIIGEYTVEINIFSSISKLENICLPECMPSPRSLEPALVNYPLLHRVISDASMVEHDPQRPFVCSAPRALFT
jgi:hypothetical protein